jgi:UDP-N-acetylmuramoyl-tripeptide--D-alanyl-D-alanine ligase
VSRFAWRWWSAGAVNLLLFGLSLVGLIGTFFTPWAGYLVAIGQLGPQGLTIRGRTSPLSWTRRMVRLASVTGAVLLVVYLTGGLTKSAFIVTAGLFLLPALTDLALVVLGPIERRLGDRWVDQASTRLRASGARVVAITGSYGKTTTKRYAAQLLSGSFRTVASPASFNNRMGLARAVNEHLVPGTEVFIAEMGTYGPGEIGELCSWMAPEVSAMVSIGPVHLERFKSEERIVAAKSEILDGARVGVIAIDHPLLAALAEFRAGRMEVITVSGEGAEARVVVRDGALLVDGMRLATVPAGVFGVNLAVAVGIALALGVGEAELSGRIGDVSGAEHRQAVSRSERGFSIIDDTFNSNPAGARSALGLLDRVGAGGRKVVVTPGMVELGSGQNEENRAFASDAARIADDLVVVGETNRRALIEGSANGRASVTVVRSRQEAVEWVRGRLGPGDAVLYENDLPDHYP